MGTLSDCNVLIRDWLFLVGLMAYREVNAAELVRKRILIGYSVHEFKLFSEHLVNWVGILLVWGLYNQVFELLVAFASLESRMGHAAKTALDRAFVGG